MFQALAAIFITLFGVVSGAWAESSACAKPVAMAEAHTVLSAVQKRYEQLSRFEANFSQASYLASLDTSESSMGKVVFARPGKMRWTYLKPEPQEFLLKDKTMWLYQPKLNQVLINSIASMFSSDLPVSFFFGLGNVERDFALQSACQVPDGIELHLTPKSDVGKGDEKLRSFTLLSTKGGEMLGASVVDSLDNVTSFRFSKIVINRQGDDKQFSLAYPPSTVIVDERQQQPVLESAHES